jgi:Zn-dependent peptidase ImmA (M78 family)
MLPEDGVRESLRQHGAVDPYSVSALMKAFRTSPIATTQRLLNLGLISEDQRLDLLGALHPA